MKALIVLLALLVGVWLWRQRRVPPPKRPAPRLPVDMVRCASCGLHLPQQEALLGHDRLFYCCEAHRNAGAAQGRRQP